MGKIMSICISAQKGTRKREVESALLIRDFGIRDDAHAGKWHRQVSLLSYETREEFRRQGAKVENGAFGENLLVSGIDLVRLLPGTLIRAGSIILEVTQIGKECHHHCTIYKEMGTCIMPKNGVFARVIEGGELRRGDEIELCIKQESLY